MTKPKKSKTESKLGEAEALWRRYFKTRDIPSRNALVRQYLPLVKYTAERMATKLPKEVEIGDLISFGTMGLFHAVKGFDPDRGVKFETYCSPRIRGAILDELRALDWVPRLIRSRSNQLEAVRKLLKASLGRTPTDKEVAEELGLSIPEYARLVRETMNAHMLSVRPRADDNDEGNYGMRELEALRDASGTQPAVKSQREDLRILVTKGLSQKERMIVILYYYEEFTMKEIGKVLDLSESRVSQMHANILLRLRGLLQERRLEFLQ